MQAGLTAGAGQPKLEPAAGRARCTLRDRSSACSIHLIDGLQARQEEGGRDFTYGWIMIDKSKTEMAAIRLLELSGDAKGWLLCYFHFLQDWERFLISKESEVGKEEKNSIMVALAQLAHCGNEKLFETKVCALLLWGMLCCCQILHCCRCCAPGTAVP